MRPALVLIQPEPFGHGYDVVPPLAGREREFREVADARQYADTIARRFGWLVHDQTGEP